jgi:hypothetical protein
MEPITCTKCGAGPLFQHPIIGGECVRFCSCKRPEDHEGEHSGIAIDMVEEMRAQNIGRCWLALEP